MSKEFKIVSFEKVYRVKPVIRGSYQADGSMAVGLIYWDEECQGWLPYADVTTCLCDTKLAENEAYVKEGRECFGYYLEVNGIATATNKVKSSGYSIYRVYQFNTGELQ